MIKFSFSLWCGVVEWLYCYYYCIGILFSLYCLFLVASSFVVLLCCYVIIIYILLYICCCVVVVFIQYAGFVASAGRGDVAVVKRRLQQGMDPDCRDYTGNTAMHVACANGHVRVIDLLKKAGADLNKRDRNVRFLNDIY